MKKTVAFLMVLVMYLSGAVPVQAAPESQDTLAVPESQDTLAVPESQDTLAVPESQNTLAVPESQNSLAAPESQDDPAAQKKSRIMVSVGTVRELSDENGETFTLTLSEDSQKMTQEQKVFLGSQLEAAPIKEVVFADLEASTYTLTISAEGYENYAQQIEVERGYDYRIHVYNGVLAGFDYTSQSTHPGMIRNGDVNMDGKIDDGDADSIIQSIESEQPDMDCDLNRDGRVSLADLQICAENLYNEEMHREASIEAIVSANNFEVCVDDTKVQIIEGNLSDILTGEGWVNLASVNGDISEENPVELEILVAADAESGGEGQSVEMGGFLLSGNPENLISAGSIEVELADGSIMEIEIPDPNPNAVALYAMSTAAAVWENGVLVVDLGGKAAVKKVTFVITGTQQNNNLAEISKVEFLNDMEKRIPPPQMDIPTGVTAEASNKKITVSWNPANNVTGYEMEISDGNTTEVRKTTVPVFEVSRFGGKELVNKTTYSVRVQSVNGMWKSGYGETVTAVPFTTAKPPAPDNLNVIGEFKAVKASWKKMEDTDTYNLYYKKKDEAEYHVINGIAGNSYTVDGLENAVTYEVYVTGVNDNGEGSQSIHSTATTLDIQPVALPEYELINISGGEGALSGHIVSATVTGNDIRHMINSPLDEGNGKSALGIFDNNYESYYQVTDWDDGVSYPGGEKGVTVQFDGQYHFGYITFAQVIEKHDISGVKVYADDKEVSGATLVRRKDADNRTFYLVKLPKEGATAQKLKVNIGCAYGHQNWISIAEMRFHAYDSLEADILGLYADDLHTSIREDVTKEMLDELETRLDTKKNGEYHFERGELLKELENARNIFNEQAELGDIVKVHPGITEMQDGGKGFSGLNAWQPLGVSAMEGETLIVYVGSNKGKTGDNTDIRLVASQYHAESGKLVSGEIALKVGRNEITVPGISSMDVERGGSVYVVYKGNNANDQYAVRVNGGTKIPVLDLYKATEEERSGRILAYVEELEKAVPKIEETHKKLKTHSNDFDETNCIAGATEIMLDQMMYSVSAKQILSGLGSGTAADKAARLESSLKAMDQMLALYYQHKGLNDSAPDQVDKLPAQHLNIRYQRMFAGAFMYAAGNHIGIEWGSVSGLASGSALVLNEVGEYVSGQLFGWGIGHEIGHNINQGSYALAEVTNNYFALLSTGQQRYQMNDVYKFVTSGADSRPSNGAVALAMYWQLHLAYDRGYHYQTYADYGTQLSSLFYARVDTYARTPSKAPKGNGDIALTIPGDRDQAFIRLASAAAERDLTDFFTRWGLVPDQETKAYISQFEPETRAIYYQDDASQVYEIKNGTGATIKDQDVLAADMKAAVDVQEKNAVHMNLGVTGGNDVLLGYEITRCMISGGQTVKQTVGFTTQNEYTDYISTINNRVVFYEVAAVDKFMNRSAVKTLNSVKIEHEGKHDKSLWDVKLSNITPDNMDQTDNDEENPDEEMVDNGSKKMIDNDAATVFAGTVDKDKNTGIITLKLNKSLHAAALRYRIEDGNAASKYRIQVSSDNTEWKTVAEGEMKTGDAETVYFQEGKDPWICTYDVSYVKLELLEANGKKVEIAELDVLGPTGDNVDFVTDGSGALAAGILKNDYNLGNGEVIPKESIVFTGSYKGHPAYNVGILYDDKGNIVGGTAEDGSLNAGQVILADVPAEGDLGETSDGTWIYYIEPKYQAAMEMPERVRMELYRVNDATTNEGQRLVSDTVFYEMPAELPEIDFTNNQGKMR